MDKFKMNGLVKQMKGLETYILIVIACCLIYYIFVQNRVTDGFSARYTKADRMLELELERLIDQWYKRESERELAIIEKRKGTWNDESESTGEPVDTWNQEKNKGIRKRVQERVSERLRKKREEKKKESESTGEPVDTWKEEMNKGTMQNAKNDYSPSGVGYGASTNYSNSVTSPMPNTSMSQSPTDYPYVQ